MPRGWTYGAEHELVDWDRRRSHDWNLDVRDVTMVNSDGIAVDPVARTYWLGGEINTRPSESASGQGDQLVEFTNQFPETTINYRSNLHVHVRVPGLREDLAKLRRVQHFVSTWMPQLFPLIEPIPEPTRAEYPDDEAYKGARKRYARRRVSHQRMMSEERVSMQMRAITVDQFLEAEALHVPTGVVHWAIAARCAINLRQLRETDTVEFRHFPGTTTPAEVHSAVAWCSTFMQMAVEGRGDPVAMWRDDFSRRPWPHFQPYDHELELGYQATAVHIVGREAAAVEIKRRLKGKK